MKIKILLSSLLISSLSWGQISTDRPDQTEASVVLPKNMLQIESGFTFQEEEVFNTLFRYGISEKLFNSSILMGDFIRFEKNCIHFEQSKQSPS